MQEPIKGLKLASALIELIEARAEEIKLAPKDIYEAFLNTVRNFRETNNELVARRDSIQTDINAWFKSHKGKKLATSKVIEHLKNIGYIHEIEPKRNQITTAGLPAEIASIPGPQLVVPADKANMVLNALNARYVSLNNALYASNIIKAKNEDERRAEVISYRNKFLDKIAPLASGSYSDITRITFDTETKSMVCKSKKGNIVTLSSDAREKLEGYTFSDDEELTTFIIKNNQLHIEVTITHEGKLDDINIESALTAIIDLEDASLSAPENKLLSYTNLKGITNGRLECNVRGKTRSLAKDTNYISANTMQEKTLKRTAIALVRDVGPFLQADERLIKVDDKPVPEKILDTFITTLLGMRYHVAPKLHGSEEVAYNVKLLKTIAERFGLRADANKIGIMNEEIRTNAQFCASVLEAKDIVFFTNSGFLDYTGSFLDLMTYQGAMDSYRALPSKLYKTSYEDNNVFISLILGVPQIGAGMWAKLKDMAGLLENKKAQVRALNDTGWSPSPLAAAIHALAFHSEPAVGELQYQWLGNPRTVPLADMFEFPAANLKKLTPQTIQEDLNYAIHGLLAYAEPWVRRGVGCSGVKDFGGTHLMEDRATARIKTAFVRNWLLHEVTTKDQVEETIANMARLVDEQNADKEGYKPIYDETLQNNVCRAVSDLVFNPDGFVHSYVEPALYAAYLREQEKGNKDEAKDFMGDW